MTSLPENQTRQSDDRTAGQSVRSPVVKQSRHKWSDPTRYLYKTERECRNGCGIVKVTQHPGFVQPWQEFYRDGELIATEATPPCAAASATHLQAAE
jgi:hypothetical protein